MEIALNIGAGDMLKRLGSGVRPDGSAPAARIETVDAMDFGSLLKAVRTGEFASGRPVTLGLGAGMEFSEAQLERLGVATDAAEAAGSSRIVAMIDDKAATIDVESREVVAGTESLAGLVLTDIDGFVFVPEGPAQEVRAIFAQQSGNTRSGAPGMKGAPIAPGLDALRNETVVSMLAAMGSQKGQGESSLGDSEESSQAA